MDIGFVEIDKWHKAKGWTGCGYHYIIRRDGELEPGRPHDMQGAHCYKENHHSIGICLVGGVDVNNRPEDNFTPAQMSTLSRTIDYLDTIYPHCEVKGHRYFNSNKACPSFDVQFWMGTKINRDEGRVDILEVIYRTMKTYPDNSEVYEVLKGVLNAAGKV